MPVETPVSLIYQMGQNPYFALFESALNEKGVYFQIESDTIKGVLEGKICFKK